MTVPSEIWKGRILEDFIQIHYIFLKTFIDYRSKFSSVQKTLSRKPHSQTITTRRDLLISIKVILIIKVEIFHKEVWVVWWFVTATKFLIIIFLFVSVFGS